MIFFINLLSKENQNLIHYSRMSQSFLRGLFFLFLIMGLMILIMTFGNIILTQEFNRLEHEIQKNDAVIAALSENQKKSGTDIRFLSIMQTAQDEFIPWTETLIRAMNVKSDGIVIEALEFNGQNGTFLLQGNADLRSSLLRYRDDLLKTEEIETIDTPLSNFLQKENILFQFQGTSHPRSIDDL